MIEIYGKESGVQPDQTIVDKNAEKGGNLLLDLSLKIPGRALVRGRGLESEWQGDLTVRGKASPAGADRKALFGERAIRLAFQEV